MPMQFEESFRELYPDMPEVEVPDFLMATTPYPMGSTEEIIACLRYVREHTDGSKDAAIAFVADECDQIMSEIES